jgi:hypothetical protein
MIKNKTNEAYKIFSRIAKSNKKTNLTELQALMPNTQESLKINLAKDEKKDFVHENYEEHCKIKKAFISHSSSFT